MDVHRFCNKSWQCILHHFPAWMYSSLFNTLSPKIELMVSICYSSQKLSKASNRDVGELSQRVVH